MGVRTRAGRFLCMKAMHTMFQGQIRSWPEAALVP
jgi:hypothetical protein